VIGADANIVGCDNAPSSQGTMTLRVQVAEMSALLKPALRFTRARLLLQKDSAI
jgi:hypothetical protein